MTYDLGSVVGLGIENRDGDGTLVDATTVTCAITLPDGTTATGTVVNPSTGSYTVDYSPTVAGRHLVRWLGTGSNPFGVTDTFDVRAADDVPVVSLTEAKAHLNIATTTTDDELRRYLDAATDLAESYTGRSLRRRTVANEKHDGGRTAVVLRQTPVVTVSTLLEDAVTFSTFTADLVNGIVYRDEDEASTWTAGRGVIDVTYVAGYTAPPADVQQAVLETLRHLWTTQRGTMAGRNPFGGDEYAGTGWSLPRRASELLDAYVIKGF